MSAEDGEKSLQNFSATFIKKDGTVDKGIDHQHIYISTLIWKYYHEDEDFCVSSNNKDFGSFGDIVVEVKQKDKPKKETYALNFQMSPGKSSLKIKDLTLENGNFNVKKYIDETQYFGEDTKAIIYTDSTFSATSGQKILLDSQTNLLIWKEHTDWRIANGIHSYKIEMKKSDYSSPLGVIYLYCEQENVKKLEEFSLKQFKGRLNSDDSSHARFVNFIHNWSTINGKKEKLTKRVLKRAATISGLSPFIKTLSFSSLPVCKNAKLLREAISKFDVIIIKEDSYGYVKKLWLDAKTKLFNNLKKANRLRIRYQILPHPIKKIEDLDGKDEETTKLLWLMGRCPLLVVGNETTFNAIYQRIEDNFVVMTLNTRLYYCTKFHKLKDLEVYPEIYEDVLENFKCFSSSGKEVKLKDLVEENEEIKDVVVVDDLVRMVDGPILIRGEDVVE